MMLNLRRYILSLTVILAACAMQSCLDDTFNNFNSDYGDGVSDLQATVEFENLTPALHSRTSGTAIGAVSNLQMVIYRVTGEGTTEFYKRIVCNTLPGYEVTSTNETEPDYPDDNKINEGKFEESIDKPTDHADFTFNDLPYGRYKIYAVANVPELKDTDCMPDDEFTSGEEHLKSMRFTWRSPLEGNGEVKENDEMFGYFTPAEQQSSIGFEAPIITINRKNTAIHAWIKRLVSKVTIAFDPSELEEAVTVYIKNVTIHDIPATCFLGKNNTANLKPDLEKDETYVGLIKNGESIDYSNGAGDDYEKWAIKLQKASGKKGSDHSNTADALFFFENMQGDYEGQKDYLKVQIPEETGTSINEEGDNQYGSDPETNDFKDRIPYGTYIEAEGYYISKNTKKMSSGKIRYRFMLGKNITYNYDAQRNYHYKLTLKFRNWANEADWHISYSEPTPSVYTPDKYYVSYLYGQESGFPIRIITGDAENTSRYILKAEIIENPWWAYDEDTDGYPPLYLGAANNPNGFAWMKSAVESGVEGGVLTTPYYVGENKNFAGFLSLRKPEMAYGKYQDIEFPDVVETEGVYARSKLQYGPAHNDALRDYYNRHNVAHAAYRLNEGTHNVGLYDTSTTDKVYDDRNAADGQYSVTRDADESVTLSIPMFTRPKKMVAASDFTGNNPYSSYMRRAIVRFTLWDEKGKLVPFKDLADENKEVEYRDVPVLQVRRIENPKAIYRAWDNDQEFKVKLMHLRNTSTQVASEFTTFNSEGPWRASILAQSEDNFIQLTGPDGTIVKNMGEYITGSTGSEDISFTYQPIGKCANATSTRCGIILVEYHDYTCNHMIFVRQGYDAPVTLGGTDWSCYQVYATAGEFTSEKTLANVDVVVTRSPLSLGSLLKRCQYNYSIREDGNPGWLAAVNSLSVTKVNADKVAANTTATWSGIEAYGWRNYASSAIRYNIGWADTWNTVDYMAGQELTVPTWKQFEDLRDQCDFGFGIAYADDATATATSLDDAYGYIDTDNTGVRNSKGIRVCIAYDSSNGKNVLFPLGKSGMGRRVRNTPDNVGSPPSNLRLEASGSGSLVYGGVSSVMYTETTTYRPIMYNHYRTTGAIYWIKQPNLVGSDSNPDKLKSYAAWDINYFTLMFNKHDDGTIANFSGGSANSTTVSDALPIKLVYKKK